MSAIHSECFRALRTFQHPRSVPLLLRVYKEHFLSVASKLIKQNGISTHANIFILQLTSYENKTSVQLIQTSEIKVTNLKLHMKLKEPWSSMTGVSRTIQKMFLDRHRDFNQNIFLNYWACFLSTTRFRKMLYWIHKVRQKTTVVHFPNSRQPNCVTLISKFLL